MEHKGFTLNELLLCLGAIGFALILATSLFNANFKALEENITNANQTSKNNITYTYEEMESDLVISATQYMNNYYKTDKMPYYKKIDIKSLYEKGYFTKIYDPSNSTQKCDGYVIFTRQDHAYSYKPYLKCGENYETEK